MGWQPVNVVMHDGLYGWLGTWDDFLCGLFHLLELVLYHLSILLAIWGCNHTFHKLCSNWLSEVMYFFRWPSKISASTHSLWTHGSSCTFLLNNFTKSLLGAYSQKLLCDYIILFLCFCTDSPIWWDCKVTSTFRPFGRYTTTCIIILLVSASLRLMYRYFPLLFTSVFVVFGILLLANFAKDLLVFSGSSWWFVISVLWRFSKRLLN